ncbi:hypothetical protein QTI51_09495 [Variovorax sp. J22G73]|uniref:hypothetical protein n=1 Tax=unclassified Variovorax TaxID=663243 RepID=UPI0025787A50|nr:MULTISPECIES: hypothetical protein [unclassified Variovorax]MDM0097510.1 hypothetical protein [Variovorax sp. J22G73]
MRKSLLILAAALSLVACGQNAPGAPGDASAATAQSSDHSWLWGLGGYMLGRMGGSSGAPHSVVNQTVVQRNLIVQRPATPVVPKPAPAVTPSFKPTPSPAPSRSFSTPSFSRGYSSPSYSFRSSGRR